MDYRKYFILALFMGMAINGFSQGKRQKHGEHQEEMSRKEQERAREIHKKSAEFYREMDKKEAEYYREMGKKENEYYREQAQKEREFHKKLRKNHLKHLENCHHCELAFFHHDSYYYEDEAYYSHETNAPIRFDIAMFFKNGSIRINN
ncbi:hypothetical protein [Algoriphagus resistens]|uniref:hypothetical protein n=1 Tax=Algoriphagus resistens TaxID=1750590 RepID=UPI00071687DB|nr:hypothetical protein [Algoriphagus resistens]